MTRKELLDAAAQCVLHDRQDQYGGMEDCFGVIANFWSVYVGKKIYPHDVACMMAMLKVARIRSNPAHADSWVDLAGYAACGAEVAPAGKKEGGFAVKSHVDAFARERQAEGCEELVVDAFDAPQTPQELYQRIVDSNPAAFKARTPTGEELAEMAGEESHGA